MAFALAGIAFATWASRLPNIKAQLDLTAGELGVTLLTGAVGSLLALPLAGGIAERIGAAATVLTGVIFAVIGIAGIGLSADIAANRWMVSVALFVASIGISLWDVAMNLEGTVVERARGRSTMPLYHAMFSAGTVLAALLGALLVWAQVPVLLHLVVVGVFVLITAERARRSFLPHRPPTPKGEQASAAAAGPPSTTARSAWTEPRTLAIGLFVLVAAFTEGTANDWIAVAFVDGHEVPAWAGVVAFACFLTAMTAGRVLGTSWLDRWGRTRVLVPMIVLAGLGSALVVFGSVPLAYLGTVLWGLGVSLGFPVGMSAAADDPRRAAARMSVVATIGYSAFIAGPPVLGLLGDQVGILRALLLVAGMLLIALATVTTLTPSREPEAARSS